MGNKVYVVRCPDYSQAEEKLGELLALMGGMGRYVKPDERLLLKVNLLEPAPPERAVCTHPAVVSAVAKQVAAQRGSAVIGDSPGASYRSGESSMRRLYEVSGMARAAAEAGAALNYDMSGREVSFSAGGLVKRLECLSPVLDADGVLNLCKLKTHVFMSMTGAVKNHFGIIPGMGKVGYHTKFQDKGRFADMLLDLAAFVKPRLSVMDAVLGMEGEGPGMSGTPRSIGLLLAAEDPLCLDIVAAELMGLPMARNPLLLAAERRGLPCRMADVALAGAEPDELRLKDFKLPKASKQDMTGLPAPLARIAKWAMTQSPRVLPALCIGCGICRDACPATAIRLTEKTLRKAKIDTGKCIRCYCCHELCPRSAVELRRGMLCGDLPARRPQ